MVEHNFIGIHPDAKIISVRETKSGRHLVRAKLWDKTLRYVSCLTEDGEFKYYRQVSSSERRRVARGSLEDHPLESLPWVLKSKRLTGLNPHWECELPEIGIIQTAVPTRLLVSPVDYTNYVVSSSILLPNDKLIRLVKKELTLCLT